MNPVHRLETAATIAVTIPSALFATATWVFAESGFDTVTAGLYGVAAFAGIAAIGVLREVIIELSGEGKPIARAATRRWIINPLRRFAGLPPRRILDNDDDDG